MDEARHRMKLYFPDTNFFLECRKAFDLAWHELDGLQPGEGPDIRLIVPSTVITEIERHKQKGNKRLDAVGHPISQPCRHRNDQRE